MPNPLIAQGTLNRLLGSVTIPGFPNLNITSSYMGKNFITITFDGDFDNLIPTGTGTVTSPEPYVTATINIDILRTQPLAAAWLLQSQTLCDIGGFSVFPDTAAFPSLNFVNGIIKHMDPGPYSGTDPSTPLILQGTFNINDNLWTL